MITPDIFENEFKILYYLSGTIYYIAITPPDVTFLIDPFTHTMMPSNSYICYPVKSSYLTEIFGIFTPVIREEINKLPKPTFEGGPIELDFSKIKVNYF